MKKGLLSPSCSPTPPKNFSSGPDGRSPPSGDGQDILSRLGRICPAACVPAGAFLPAGTAWARAPHAERSRKRTSCIHEKRAARGLPFCRSMAPLWQGGKIFTENAALRSLKPE
ncbi:hypothetical protein DESPIG_02501 [Desulfovibrio piger ATCC 29098]|uniref:Uncharacterized protein n=1 Tax=Desulfovibrio piger ATCC 29098 TaxID=411464 RepID=B6WWN2_9BACT|nr:hypothetical protein DESPIG_02501 [Desulfovibrio piger ATCC 29098]